jgi:hypothetical protein
VKDWVGRRNSHGAPSNLLKELAEEDPTEYHRHMRMTVENFEELLTLIEPLISKKNTMMRDSIPARVKLEVTLGYLASGDSFQSLALFFRVPATSISQFLPDVLRAITSILSALKVSCEL